MHTLLSVPKSEMLDVEHNIKRLAKNFSDMGCSCEEAVESLKKLQIKEGKHDMNTLTFVLTDGTVITTQAVKGDSGETINKPKSTNCPNCGAPVDIHAEKCAYCDTPYI